MCQDAVTKVTEKREGEEEAGGERELGQKAIEGRREGVDEGEGGEDGDDTRKRWQRRRRGRRSSIIKREWSKRGRREGQNEWTDTTVSINTNIRHIPLQTLIVFT